MFNPLNDPQAEQWFQRFAAVTRNLPFNEYAVQRQEIQQHLEALAAAHEELGSPPAEAWRLALKQFGNPTKIGRKLCREWQRGRTGSQADTEATSFAIGLVSIQATALIMYDLLRVVWRLCHGIMPTGSLPLPAAVWLIVGLGGTLLVGVAIGCNHPLQAIKAAFYSSILSAFWWGFGVTTFVSAQFLMGASVRVHLLLLTSVWALGLCVVAYFASVTKRGWYRPSLADFMLTLPRKQQKLSH